MAKKSSNPADAFRKAQRAKELKKNKEQRRKVREVQTVKRDTRDLEAEIRSLKGKSDNASKSRIAELEAELAHVNKTKEAYVKEHPEARDRVFGRSRGQGGVGGGPRRDADGGEGSGSEGEGPGAGTGSKGKGRLYDEDGRLKDPTRSAYYDPVYNPWGVPPPGMPYRERTPQGGIAESDSDDSDADSNDEDDSDDDIAMPQGPRPDTVPTGEASDGESDDSDDIPLPEGPPPPKAPPPIPPSGPAAWGGRGAPTPVPFHNQPFVQPPPQPPFQGGMGMAYPPFPPPQHQVYQQQQHQPYFPQSGSSYSHPSHQRPMRPPRHQGPNAVQDPLSDEPTQTYQGYRQSRAGEANLPPKPVGANLGEPSTSSLPARPGGPSAPAPATAVPAAAEISAAPVLRDLRKETTVFVPRNLKKKGAVGGGGMGVAGGDAAGVRARINAAPGGGVVDEEGDEVVVRQVDSGLMGKLKGMLGSDLGGGATAGSYNRGSTSTRADTSAGGQTKATADDDYERFLAGLGDIA